MIFLNKIVPFGPIWAYMGPNPDWAPTRGTCCLWWRSGVPGMQAGRRPIVTQARRGLGGEKCPRGFPPWVCAGPPH